MEELGTAMEGAKAVVMGRSYVNASARIEEAWASTSIPTSTLVPKPGRITPEHVTLVSLIALHAVVDTVFATGGYRVTFAAVPGGPKKLPATVSVHGEASVGAVVYAKAVTTGAGKLNVETAGTLPCPLAERTTL